MKICDFLFDSASFVVTLQSVCSELMRYFNEMRYLFFATIVAALWCFVGCRGSHNEGSRELADIVKFDDISEDSYFDDEEAPTDSTAMEPDSIEESADSLVEKGDSTAAEGDSVVKRPVKPAAVPANGELASDERSLHPWDGVVHRMRVNPVVGSLRKTFNDSNAVHLSAATRLGFSPITDLRTAWAIEKPIREVHTCADFHIDKLSHSMPYLVPEAEMLLHEIGRSFSDTIRARGGKSYKIKVTSLTRTDVTVRRLRRRNRAATQESAHRFGTTFDISYSKFICCDSSYVVHEGDLKNILAEVLYRLRGEGRCYVKYEHKQGCFHITTRPRGLR